MNDRFRFAEAVCEGHPDRLADRIAARIVDFACGRRRQQVRVGGWRFTGTWCSSTAALLPGPAVRAIAQGEVAAIARAVFREAGYGTAFIPAPDRLDVKVELCLGPPEDDERAVRHVSDDQAIAVGHAVQGARARYIPLEQALANECVAALETLRRASPQLGLGPDGKVLIVVRGRALVGVSVSIHHAPETEWVGLTRAARNACEAVAHEYVDAGELEPMQAVDWLMNGAGAFEIGGPEGDNGLSGKKLVAQAYGTAVPIGGGATFGKDPRKVDPRGQRMAREMALDLVKSGKAREATVWLAWRPGDVDPRWVEVVTVPIDERI